VGDQGTILHYTAQTGRWEPQSSGTTNSLHSIFGSGDGAQLWAVGEKGTILHYTAQTGRWEPQSSGTTKLLHSVFGSGGGAQLWAVGDEGTILRYTAQTGRWEPQSSGTINTLLSIFGSGDGAQLWAVGDIGTILHATEFVAPYISEVKLAPTLTGAELQVRVVARRGAPEEPLDLVLSGATERSFKNGYELKDVKSKVQHNKPTDPWTFDFNPSDIDVDAGVNAHLRIQLEQGIYKTFYDVDLPYNRSEWFRHHPVATLAATIIGALIAGLTLLLLVRPLWILFLYRNLKIYSLVEQIEIPGIGKLLQFLLKLTILPWFVTHPRTLRAWVNANRRRAAATWDASVRTPSAMQTRNAGLDLPYVALPVEVKDVTSRLLNPPLAEDFEALFKGARNVVQIIGQGGTGKTTLAKHIGGLALAGGEPGAFKSCRLPIWVDEDFSDLMAVVKRKINGWFESGEDIEEPFLKALLESGLLVIIVDRVSERLISTQDCLARVHGSVRCNAILMTTRQAIAVEVPDQRFIYPQALDSSTLLSFMTEMVKYYFRGSDKPEERQFFTIQSQLELGKRLADLIAVRTAERDKTQEIPMLPLPVVLFVSDAVALVRNGKSLDALPSSLPDVYANYLRRVNPKVHGIENGLDDETMLRTAKALARLALGSDYIPKEFSRDRGMQCLKSEAADIPAGIDPLLRLVANGVLLSKELGATTYLRFALDPVAEFLAAEAYFDQGAGEEACLCLRQLLSDSERAPGFHTALLHTIQARDSGRS
jgi:hypothetical protein